MSFYNENIKSVLEKLHVDSENGLSSELASKNLDKYGKNEFTQKKDKSILADIKEALLEPMMVILLLAAVVSVVIGEYYDAVGIVCAVALGVTIGIITEGKSKKAAESLAKMTRDIEVKVLRDGNVQNISKSNLVPGDIIYLETGDMIPADGRFIESLDLKVREDMLTGESDDVKKDAEVIIELEEIDVKGEKKMQEPIPAKQVNMGFTGTLVAYGKGTMVVTGTGDNTEMGKIAESLQDDGEETPLQIKLGKLGETIAKISSIIAALLFMFMVVRIVSGGIEVDTSGVVAFLDSIGPIKSAFVVCIALIVAAVPEGLPTMINMTLALTMQKMAKINALVTKKEACETIGSVSVICSDKTGTLTQNRMTVEKVFLNGEFVELNNIKDNYFINNCLLNSTADITYEDNKWNYLGNSTECALLLALKNHDYKEVRRNASIKDQMPFSSMNKYMATMTEESAENDVLYLKGAPEVILDKCGFEVSQGKIIKLTDNRKDEIINEIAKLQEKSMRILGFAYKNIEESAKEAAATMSEENLSLAQYSQELIFNGFTAIKDPLRPDVKKAIEDAISAGIETKMLTGDNINTARAIGEELGMLSNGKRAVEARFIDTLTDEELMEEIKTIAIVARSKPETKLRIVNALQRDGEVVAVTGDGINDAPALTKADVGIAMGITGTEVSKNAADIILTDDNFATIINGVKWGRGVYENFQRFIQFQLTVNIIAFLIAIVSQVLGMEMPFTTIQLLWVNIIMDGPPALALGLEPIREAVFKRKPVNRNASIITRTMIVSIVLNALYVTSVILIQMKFNILGASEDIVGSSSEMETVLFGLFAFSALFNAFNCREFGSSSIFKNFLKNKTALIIIGATAAAQLVFTEVFSKFFDTVPLSFVMWGKVILLAACVIVVNEIVKLIIRLVKIK